MVLDQQGNNLNPVLQGLIDEQKEIDIKRTKLEKVVTVEGFEPIDIDSSLLLKQLKIMKSYSLVLGERIERFK